MSVPGTKIRDARRAKHQRGQAALLLVALMTVGISILVYSVTNPAAISIVNEKKNATALAQAKEALIGYAAAHSSKPGILPCPDMDNDGTADAPCGADYTTAVGRLPWKTLGLPDLRDAVGECLWYAVSGNYKNSGPTGESGSAAINPDSPGTLAIHDSSGAVLHAATTVVAIVFSPGLVVSGQNRSPVGTTVCGGNATASNYLETYTAGATTFNNSTGNDFVTAPAVVSLDALNDQLLPVTTDALFQVVNIRVAKDVITALEAYRTANSYYPFANSYTSGTNYGCSSGLYRGRFPITLGTCLQSAWGSILPSWFAANNWNHVTHYAVSSACGQASLSGLLTSLVPGLAGIVQALCTTTGNLNDLFSTLVPLVGNVVASIVASALGPSDDPITVSGISSNVRVLVIVTGRAISAQTHPCASVASCMDDANNADVAPNGGLNYAKPSRFPTSNDRMAMTCASGAPCSVLP